MKDTPAEPGIVVALSDAMCSATMIDRHDEISKDDARYALQTVGKRGRWVTVFSGSVAAWQAWASHCDDNATGALDHARDIRANRQAAERIRAAIAAARQARP